LYPCVSHQAGHQRQTRPPVTQSQQQQSSSSSDKATKQQQAWVLSGDTANVAWVHDGAQHLVAEQQQQQQQRVLQVRAPVMPAQAPAEAAAADHLPHVPRTLHELLVFFQQQQQQQQQCQLSPREAAAASQRLDRKLTSVITCSCLSAADVADALLAAESCGRLNCTHVAAALARLARLAAADAAAMAATSSSSSSSNIVVARVPLQPQQWGQMEIVKKAAAAALTAAPGGSRWHILPPPGQQQPAVQLGPDEPANLVYAGDSCARGVGDKDCDSYIYGYDHDADGVTELQRQQEQQQHLLAQLVIAVEVFWSSMPAAALTSCCWALAVLGQVLPESLLPQVGRTVLLMAEHLSAMTGERPGAAAAAAGQQHQVTSQNSTSGASMAASPRQLVLLLWSLARMQIDPQDLLQQQTAGSGDSSSSRDCCIIWRVMQHIQRHIRDLSAQSLVLLLWACSSFRSALPAPAATALLDAAAQLMRDQALIPHALSVTLWAAARLQLPADAGWLASWLVNMRAALPACNGHDVSMSVWALATLGVAPPSEWLLGLSIRAAQQAQKLSPTELPVLLWSWGRLRYRPPLSVALELLARGRRLAAVGQLSPQGLALLVWSCGTLGLPVSAGWLDDVLEAAGCYLPLFSPVEASGLLVGLVRLQHIPDQVGLRGD
jgi:hypothetical protein